MLVHLAGLFVPSSDVDVVVMNSQCGTGNGAIKQALYKLSAALRKHGAAHSIQVQPLGFRSLHKSRIGCL